MEKFKLSPCGRYVGLVGSAKKGGGFVNVLDAGTAQWIAQVRVDGRGGVAHFAWWSDGNGMCVASKNGEVSEWDGRLRRVVARWTDAGAVGTTVITLGGSSGRKQLGGDRWVALGSSSGIVNIYDRKPWQGAVGQAEQSKKGDIESAIPTNPTPVRALDQLTTPISHLVFAKDGQFMVMASRWKRDALRLSKSILDDLESFFFFFVTRFANSVEQFIYHLALYIATGQRQILHLVGFRQWPYLRSLTFWPLPTSKVGFDCGRSTVDSSSMMRRDGVDGHWTGRFIEKCIFLMYSNRFCIYVLRCGNRRQLLRLSSGNSSGTVHVSAPSITS
jgi:hypothetical protein